MAVSIEELLHHENFLKTIEKVKGGVPDGIIPKRMFTRTDTTIGNQGSYFKVESTRRVAQQCLYGAPSKAAKFKGVSKQLVTLLHSFENFQHDPQIVAILKSTNGGVQKRGAELVGRKLAEFTQRFINLRRATWYSAMATGYIYFDEDGELLPDSSGAVNTVDFSIPAGHRNQLDWDGNGAIIGASWATAGTDIMGDVRELKKAAIATTGYPIKKVYYGPNIPGYLSANTALKEFLSRNPEAQKAVIAGDIPDGLLGLTWVDAQDAFYEDKNGTNKHFWDGDKCVFTPDETDMGWWGFIEGSYNIPTDVGKIMADIMHALNSLTEIFGMFGYASVTHDPVGLKQYAGDTFLPLILVPNAIWIADVTP